MINREIFRDIKGYEGKYQISETGKVYSAHNGRTLKTVPNKNYGYHQVMLWCNSNALREPIVGSLMKKVENPFLNRELSVSLQRDLVPGAVAPGEKGTGWESRTDGAAVCSRW